MPVVRFAYELRRHCRFDPFTRSMWLKVLHIQLLFRHLCKWVLVEMKSKYSWMSEQRKFAIVSMPLYKVQLQINNFCNEKCSTLTIKCDQMILASFDCTTTNISSQMYFYITQNQKMLFYSNAMCVVMYCAYQPFHYTLLFAIYNFDHLLDVKQT